MVKKRKKSAPGAPAWMITYGDMVTLLLTFFIMLASMANYEDFNEKFMTAIKSIREAMGMEQQDNARLDAAIEFNSLMHKVQTEVQQELQQHDGDRQGASIYKKFFRLRRIRDGMKIALGGPVAFDPFSAKLNEEGKNIIRRIGDQLKGRRNRIEIRGHAAEEPRPADWSYEDSMKLSYQRAEHVSNELMLRGVDPRAIVLVAAGANEPAKRPDYESAVRINNRRVEIIVRESLIDDYAGQSPPNKPANKQLTKQPADLPTTKW